MMFEGELAPDNHYVGCLLKYEKNSEMFLTILDGPEIPAW